MTRLHKKRSFKRIVTESVATDDKNIVNVGENEKKVWRIQETTENMFIESVFLRDLLYLLERYEKNRIQLYLMRIWTR